MRPRTVGILFLVVAALLAYIWFFESDLPSTGEREKRARRVLDLEVDDVDAIAIVRGDERLRLERDPVPEVEEGDRERDGEEAPPPFQAPVWRLVEPLTARADNAAVGTLIDTLVTLEKQRTLTDTTPEEAGFEPLRAEVTLVTPDGERRLRIGQPTVTGSSLLVAVDGSDEIHIVRDRVWGELERAPGDWRSREVFPWTRDDIQRISLGGGAAETVLARRGDDFWIEAPVVDRADADRVSELMRELTGMRVTDFLDDIEAPPATEASIEVALTDRPDPFVIELAGPVEAAEHRTVARADGQSFEVETSAAELAVADAETWRSRRWAALETYEIDKLTVTDSAGTLTLDRAGADWLRGDSTIPFTPVSDLLYAVTSAEAGTLTPPGDHGAPTLTIELTGSDRTETLSLYKATAEGVPATSEGRDATLLLSDETVAELTDNIEAVRTADPVPSDAPTD